MKFNEKLTNLRKQMGISQEELGYKLNVTRQTVSKWELGQTTPEMDKLIEMSKLFNVSVDELVNETQMQTNVENKSDITETQNDTTNDNTNTKIEDKEINNNSTIDDKAINKKGKRETSIITIIVIALIIIGIVILIRFFAGFTLFKSATNKQNGFFDKFLNIFDKATDSINETKNDMDNFEKNLNVRNFNSFIEIYKGTVTASKLNSALDEISTSNKKNEKKITVKYNEIETQNPDEITNIKKDIVNSNEYELSFDYDEEGYINKATIEKLEKKVNEFDISMFNSGFEMYSGSNMGGHVVSALDKVVTSNKKNDRKITVKYKGTQTQDEATIKNIKQKIDTFANYNISYNYDSDGFINEMTIENM